MDKSKLSDYTFLSDLEADALVETGFFGGLLVKEINKFESSGKSYAVGVAYGPDFYDIMDEERFEAAVDAIEEFTGIKDPVTLYSSENPNVRFALAGVDSG